MRRRHTAGSMNVLLLSSRFPWPPFTGDRLRAKIWLSALASETNVALVAPAGQVPSDAPRFRFYAADRSAARAVAGAWRVGRGAPAHSLLAAPYDWAGAIARARNDVGEFDVSIVILSRLDPWVRGHLPEGLRVLDAIDSLRRSMTERMREGSALTKWFWRAESRRVARAEEDAVHAYDRIVVVSAEDSAELGAIAISNAVAIAPLAAGPRAFDFGFWGRLAYFANADAAAWLLAEIWPAVRARRPQATLVIGGADVPAHIRAADGRDGVTVQSPVSDVASLARNIKVALFPVRYGTGQSNKVLEAAEAGCTIVATSKAMRGLDALTGFAGIAEDAAGLAQLAVGAISDDTKRVLMATALRGMIEKSYSRQDTLDRLSAVVRQREAAA